MGWKTPKIEYVNGYKIVEVEGPIFKVYDGDRQLGDDFPTPAKLLLTQPRCQNGIIHAARRNAAEDHSKTLYGSLTESGTRFDQLPTFFTAGTAWVV